MDAVLPHEGGIVAVAAVKPSTYGPGAYDADVEFVGDSLRRLQPVAVALELCPFRAAWYLVQEFGHEALREARREEGQSGEEGAFERAFRSALCQRGAPLPAESAAEAMAMAVAAAGAEGSEEEAAAAAVAAAMACSQPRRGAPLRGARRGELAAVRSYLAQAPGTELWLVDRDARRNQPRVEAWAGAEGAALAAIGFEAPALATDRFGRTRTTQYAAMRSPANDRLRKRVLAEEREEYIVGELHRRLWCRAAAAAAAGGEADGVVLLLLGATHLEGVIRRWFAPPEAHRMRELDDDQGLALLQPPDILEMALRGAASCWEVLDAFEFYSASPFFGDSEVVAALESLADCCRGAEPSVAAHLLASSRLVPLRRRADALQAGEDSERAAAALRELYKVAG